jgi:parallel beta helix pectate lyase-like protein
MNRSDGRSVAVLLVVSLAIVVVGPRPAFAQATRTWVSGVGDDANPCSRTAPCKTFAGAISKTAAGGEIDALDPGGFGAVTITKSMTIDGGGEMASILASGQNGITVNGAGIVVTIRNLSINGAGTGLEGIKLLQGASLNVERSTIFGFTQNGIRVGGAGSAAIGRVFVHDVVVRNNGGGVTGGILFQAPGTGSPYTAVVDDTFITRSNFGLRAEANTNVSMRNSSTSGNAASGVVVISSAGAAVVSIENSLSANNAAGVLSVGAAATARLSNTTVVNNTNGLSAAGGAIQSFGNNMVKGNGTDGAPTLVLDPA